MSNDRKLVRVNGDLIEAGGSSSWEEIVATFVSSQDVRPSSRSLYARTLSLFFDWVQAGGRKLDSLSRVDVLEYKDELLESGLSNLTVGNYIAVVRKFYKWAEAMRLYPNIAEGIKPPKRIQAHKKVHLPDEKSKELLAYFQGRSLRDFAIVNLLLRTGLRTIEVARADVGDITLRVTEKGTRRILKVWGKGRDSKDEFVVLTDKAWLPIKEYLKTRKSPKSSEPLFISLSHRNDGERLTTRTISGICKEGLVAIGLDSKEYTAHSLRHTTGVGILKKTLNLSDVQRVLRHSSTETSKIYTESITEDLRLESPPESLLDDLF